MPRTSLQGGKFQARLLQRYARVVSSSLPPFPPLGFPFPVRCTDESQGLVPCERDTSEPAGVGWAAAADVLIQSTFLPCPKLFLIFPSSFSFFFTSFSIAGGKGCRPYACRFFYLCGLRLCHLLPAELCNYRTTRIRGWHQYISILILERCCGRNVGCIFNLCRGILQPTSRFCLHIEHPRLLDTAERKSFSFCFFEINIIL